MLKRDAQLRSNLCLYHGILLFLKQMSLLFSMIILVPKSRSEYCETCTHKHLMYY